MSILLNIVLNILRHANKMSFFKNRASVEEDEYLIRPCLTTGRTRILDKVGIRCSCKFNFLHLCPIPILFSSSALLYGCLTERREKKILVIECNKTL